MSSSEPGLLQRVGEGARTTLGVGGLIALILGLLILIFPDKSSEVTMTVVATIAAAYALVAGVVYLGSAIFNGALSGGQRFGNVILGLLYIAGGVIMAANLGSTSVVLASFLSITIGVLWIFEGIMAFATLSISASKVWSVLYGIISLIAGASLIFSPLISFVTLWVLLGVWLVVMGIVQIIRAFQLRALES